MLDGVLVNLAVMSYIGFPRGDLPELVYHDIVNMDFFTNQIEEGIVLRKILTD